MIDKDLKSNLIGSYCVCYNINYDEIADVVANTDNIKSLDDVQRYFVCGLKCKLCRPDIEKIIHYYRVTKAGKKIS